MATATSGQVAQTQHELALRVSNKFIAARLASARQEDENFETTIRSIALAPSGQDIKQERNRMAAGQAATRHTDNQRRLATVSNQSSNDELMRANGQTKLSINWAQPADGRSPVGHETDSATSCASVPDDGRFGKMSNEKNNGDQCSSGGEQTNKPHVGPMGIFFKVWSLVKVTKSRHSRMKQQIGETNAGQQFRFVPGEQFGPSQLAGGSASPEFSGPHSVSATPRGSSQQQHLPVQRLVLHDGHFKRAGSQPLPSGHLETRELNAGHLQIGHTTNGLQALNSNTATGTTSSSSGVSSTTSSTLATNYTDALQTRNDSRRLNETTSVGPSAGGQRQNGRSWSARMKPNSFTANQPQQVAGGNSHNQRHLRANQRNTPDKRQSVQLAATANGGGGSQSPEEAKRQTRAQSELRQLEGVRRKAISLAKSSSPAAIIGNTKSKMSLRHFRLRHRQDSMSDGGVEANDDDEEDEEDDDEDDDDQRGRGKVVAATRTRGQSGIEQDEDSDLNDIYSTPNDSIQSVPSGQMMLGNDSNNYPTRTQQQQRRAPTPKGSEIRTPPPNGSGRMTKSFSANYFSQLTASEAQGARSQRGASDEPKLTGSNNSTAILEHDKINGRKHLESRPAATQPSGSRFFISSSSSEDSNQAQSAGIEIQSPSADSGSVPLKQQQQQIPIQTALHYHGPAIARPNSLAVSSNPVHLVVQSPSIQTPSTLILNGACLEPSCLAMSPILTENFQPSRVLPPPPSPSCRLIKSVIGSSQYKKSPSLFDMKSSFQPASQTRFLPSAHYVQRYSSKYPQREPMSSFLPKLQFASDNSAAKSSPRRPMGKFFVPNSVSLHDCKLTMKHLDGKISSPARATNEQSDDDGDREEILQSLERQRISSEYKLAQMLLELGSNPGVKDESGHTALMHAILSENLSAFKCLIEHGVDLNETNNEEASALDLICSKPSNETLLEMLKLMIDNRVDLDRARGVDGSRLLDRLISEHQAANNDKSNYIDCLLHNGAKLGSSTWMAARGKHEIQLKLLRKLCQDGYHLYKKCSIEAAVFRFEYALKRIDELEQQLLATDSDSCHRSKCQSLYQLDLDEQQAAMKTTQLVKYQTFLGLSRCERKRGFFKRALEFANMSILIDSTSYEGYYSKAHILKDIGEKEDAILTIDQTGRLVSKSIELIRGQLNELDTQEESLVFDGCFNVHEPNKLNWIESTRLELQSNLNYLTEAKRHVTRLRDEIVNDKRS